MMENLDNTELPKIKILGIKKNDTDYDVEFEVCDEFLDYAKFELNKKELSDEELSDYVKTIINKSLKKEDGYDIKKDFKKTESNIDN